MRETAYNFKFPVIRDIDKQYDKANDDLRQFVSSFEKIRNLCGYDSSFEHESEEFRNALEKYETLSVTFTEQVADRIRTQAQIEKKSVSNFIKDILTDKLDKEKT